VTVEWDELCSQLNSPEKLIDFLWEKWVQHWWGNFQLCVRSLSGDRDETIAEVFLDQDSDPNAPNYLVYDHRSPPQEATQLFSTAAFHESFSASAEYSFLRKEENPPWTRWRVKEAAAVKVGVLDERIFLARDSAAKKGVGKYDCDDYKKVAKAWEKRRVWLLSHQDAIDAFDEFVDNLEREVRGVLNERDKESPLFDFFIIHQGIIDEIKRNDAKKRMSRFQQGWSKLQERVRWLIIDTGRGRPDQAIKDCLRWVEYSNLADCLIQRAAAKMDLAYLLFALKAEFVKMEVRESG